MGHDESMFGGAEAQDDPYMQAIVESLIAEGVDEEEMAARIESSIPAVVKGCGKFLLDKLKRGSRSMLADRGHIRKRFSKHQREKWGQPLDHLLMLLEGSSEAGQNYNTTYHDQAASENDYVFFALCRLHARACLITSEVLWLLEGGYASGAMARWRTLHEIVVVGCFLRNHGLEVAERYLLHHVAEAHKSATSYQEHSEKLGQKPFSGEEMSKMQSSRDSLRLRFGKESEKDWGWAAEALKPKPASFSEIEKTVSMEHYRPYFKLSCHSNHAGSKGIFYDLGNDLTPPDGEFMIAGPSDAGLSEPGTLTTNSLLQATSNLLLHREAKLSVLIVVESLKLLADETLESFEDADQRLREKARELQRRKQNGDTALN